MTELKTLKDIDTGKYEIEFDENEKVHSVGIMVGALYGEGKWIHQDDLKDELRAEAIKWIKDYEDKSGCRECGLEEVRYLLNTFSI